MWLASVIVVSAFVIWSAPAETVWIWIDRAIGLTLALVALRVARRVR